jgi:hypothetical protein
LVAGLLLWSCTRDAAAAEEPIDVDLTYEPPPSCPSKTELLEQVRKRVAPTWHSETDRRSFVVRIERLGDGSFSGRLEVGGARRGAEAREFHAGTCRDVSAALVVFIAIALDPATTEAPPVDEVIPPPELPEQTPRSLPPPAPSARPAPAVRPPRPPRPPPSTWAFTSGIDLTYLHAPRDTWGARVAAQLTHGKRGDRIAPALRLSWGYAGFDTFPRSGGKASFRFETARASTCAVVDLAPAPFTFEPCVGLDFGSLSARSNDIPQVGHASTSWSALAGALRVSWPVLPWLAIEGELGLEAPFTRPSFALIDPVRVVYRPPSVFFTGGAGIALTARFP